MRLIIYNINDQDGGADLRRLMTNKLLGLFDFEGPVEHPNRVLTISIWLYGTG